MVELIRRSADIAWVDDGERVVVVRLDDLAADPIVLSGSAAAVWAAVDDGRTADEVVARIAEDYGLEVEVVREAVEGFLDDAAARGLVRGPQGR